MKAIDPSASVAALVAEVPSRSHVFDDLGIDYCCQGTRSLVDWCRERSLDVGEVTSRILRPDGRTPKNEQDWGEASLTELCDHIEAIHHAYLREKFPWIARTFEDVVEKHGAAHPFLQQLRRVFHGLQLELQMHMGKEEQVLFPWIRRLEAGSGVRMAGIAMPIEVMEHEHASAAHALTRIRELTANFSAPGGACDRFKALYAALGELDHELRVHIHEENNILFPAALALEEGQSDG